MSAPFWMSLVPVVCLKPWNVSPEIPARRQAALKAVFTVVKGFPVLGLRKT